MFENQEPIKREFIEDALSEFKESTGFDFMEIIMDDSLSESYYNSDSTKDLTSYLKEAENTYECISQIRDKALRFI